MGPPSLLKHVMRTANQYHRVVSCLVSVVMRDLPKMPTWNEFLAPDVVHTFSCMSFSNTFSRQWIRPVTMPHRFLHLLHHCLCPFCVVEIDSGQLCNLIRCLHTCARTGAIPFCTFWDSTQSIKWCSNKNLRERCDSGVSVSSAIGVGCFLSASPAVDMHTFSRTVSMAERTQRG